MKPTSNQVVPLSLKPHPCNVSIYGEEDVTELVEMIRASGWVKPLVCTTTGTIISGHRRWKAALELGLQTVPVEVREFADEIAELQALLLENASRFKSVEQKVREAQVWKGVEEALAKKRMSEAGSKSAPGRLAGSQHKGVENFPHLSTSSTSRKTRDSLASRVGLGSGRTYSKAAKVVAVIDSDTQNGNLASAQGLRKVLNEQSVDAAHTLIKKPPQERYAIANLIATGEAKSTFQARQMVKQNNSAEFSDPTVSTLAGFSVGDWVTVNENAQSKIYVDLEGQVEQILLTEQQISVNLEANSSTLRFYPHELTRVAKASPPCPFRVDDIVFVDIDRHEAVSSQEKKWNHCWVRVTQIGEMGSVTVDIGKETLQLFPRDLKTIDAPSDDLRDVVERVLRLRGFELDEIEERMLDVFQRREWFTEKQMIHLKNIETLYLQTLYAPRSFLDKTGHP